MFHELRLYHPAPGRIDDLVERIGSVMHPFFERHGFPKRLGQWTVVAGGTTPLFAWMLRWTDLAQRTTAFAALNADAEWQAVRTRTNGPGEMVKRYDLRFLAPAAAWTMHRATHERPASCPLYEVRVHPVAVGRTRHADQALAEVDLPALADCGAAIAGVFDNIVGGAATPGVTLLLGWQDRAQRRRALAAYKQHASVVAARRRERQKWGGEHVLGEGSSLLLEPSPFGAIDLQDPA